MATGGRGSLAALKKKRDSSGHLRAQAQTLRTWLEVNALGHLWRSLNGLGYNTIIDFMITPWEEVLDDLSDARASFEERKKIYELRQQFATQQKAIEDRKVMLLLMTGVDAGILKHAGAKAKLLQHIERVVFDACPVEKFITLDGERPVLILKLFRDVALTVVKRMDDRLRGVMHATCKVHQNSSLFPSLEATSQAIKLVPLQNVQNFPDDDALLNAFDEPLLQRFCETYGYDHSHLGTKQGLSALAVSIGKQVRPLLPSDDHVNVYGQRQGPLRGKDNLKIGDIITLDGLRIGTIKYIGKIKNSFNKNYGIQLHTHPGVCSGDVEGETYFECPEGMGIFVERNMISGRCTQMLKSLKYIDFDVSMDILAQDDDQDFFGPPFWRRGRAAQAAKDMYTVAPPMAR